MGTEHIEILRCVEIMFQIFVDFNVNENYGISG